MLKKTFVVAVAFAATAATVVVVVAALAVTSVTISTAAIGVDLSYLDDDDDDDGMADAKEHMTESEPVAPADVVMPTKVSRPGCEKTDRCYIPSMVTVEKGRTVTWINEDSAFHSVTSGLYDAPTELFDSGYLDPSEAFSYTFTEYGVYDYHCTLHPWMEAQVTVK